MGELLFLVIFGAVLYVLGHLARRFPHLGIGLGIGICVATLGFWFKASSINFRSEGSMGGPVLLVVIVFVGMIALGVGFYLIGLGLKARRGEEIDVAEEVRNNMAPLVGRDERE